MNNEELEKLLSEVRWVFPGSYFEGEEAFTTLLGNDDDGTVFSFLLSNRDRFQDRRAGFIAFAIAEKSSELGLIEHIRERFSSPSADVREFTLNGLWEPAGGDPSIGPQILELAVLGASDLVARVRVEAAGVMMNHCGREDVTSCIGPLLVLLKDRAAEVRTKAAYVVGNFAKHGVEVAVAIPQLRRNLKSVKASVRESSAWALWHLSRFKHDISAAVPELMRMLHDVDENSNPREAAVGALLHHARKSELGLKEVREGVKVEGVKAGSVEVRKFLEALEKIEA